LNHLSILAKRKWSQMKKCDENKYRIVCGHHVSDTLIVIFTKSIRKTLLSLMLLFVISKHQEAK